MARLSIKIANQAVNLSDMSRRTGLSVTHLSNVFGGRKGISMDAAIKIAADVGISIDQLTADLHTRRPK